MGITYTQVSRATRDGRAGVDLRGGSASFGIGMTGVLALSAAHGGYFSSSWGWAILAFVAVLVWALGLRVATRPSGSEVMFASGVLVVSAWFALSALWGVASASVNESLRTLVYGVGAAASISVVRRGSAPALLAGVLLGASLTAGYALATRLFPDRVGTFDSVAGYRLAAPIGYWNALGLLCVIAVLVAFALAASASSAPRAAFAAAPVPLLLLAEYFTFSRGSWIALGAGLLFAIAFDPRRLQLTATAALVGGIAAIGIAISSRSTALTHQHALAGRAAHDGHRIGLLVLLLTLAVAALMGLYAMLRPRLSMPVVASRAYAVILAVLATGALVAVLVHLGGPEPAAKRVWRSFASPQPRPQTDLGKRLFTFSGNGRADLWLAAWRDFKAHPILGSGGGSYEGYWLAHRKTPVKVRDAHNLYLETLAEAGVVGLTLLLLALCAPLFAAVRARKRRGVIAVAGAYVAYLAGAAVDWDWEITSVTLAAIFVGVALLASARPDDEREASPALRYGALGVALAIGVVGFVFVVGNMFLSRASAAASNAKWATAARDAHRAASWLPWSTQPWQQLGEAQLGQGHSAAARVSFRKAISKDKGDWNLWLDLARASTGKTQREALAHATKLNPLSPEIAAFRSDLGSQPGISITAGGNG